jgi:hypothetical protein
LLIAILVCLPRYKNTILIKLNYARHNKKLLYSCRARRDARMLPTRTTVISVINSTVRLELLFNLGNKTVNTIYFNIIEKMHLRTFIVKN